MDGRHHVGCERRRDQLPALLGHLEGRRDERLRRGRSEAHHDLWFEDPDLRVEPEPARRDLAPVRLFVQTSLAGRAPLEVLHRVGQVHGVAVDPRGRERLIEHAPGGADERLAGDVLLVTRLLADEDDLRGPTALAEHRLSGVFPEVARLAMRRRVAPGGEALRLRQVGIPVPGLGHRFRRLWLGHVGQTEQASGRACMGYKRR